MNTPRRHAVLKLNLQADSKKDLIDALESIVRQVQMDDMTTGALGGPTYGFTYSLDYDPSITHDSYFEAIKRYKEPGHHTPLLPERQK